MASSGYFFLDKPMIDEETIREKLKNSLEITRGCLVEIIMRDNHTIRNNPQNVIRMEWGS